MLAAHKIMFLESSLFTVAVVIAAVIVGAFAGGFAYTMSWRMSQGRALFGGSTCPECGHRLSLRERIPLVSYVMQRGCCLHCNEPISMAYPTSELLGAGIFASLMLRHGVTMLTFELLALAFVLMVATMTSLMDYRVPNGCMLAAVLIRAIYLGMLYLQGEYVWDQVLISVAGAVLLGMPLLVAVWLSTAMLARDITGLGTVKLIAVVGLYLGWQQGLFCIAGAFLLGAFIFIVYPHKLLAVEVEGGAQDPDDDPPPAPRELRAAYDEDLAEPMRLIPFTPSIVIACWVMLLLGVAPALWNTPVF